MGPRQSKNPDLRLIQRHLSEGNMATRGQLTRHYTLHLVIPDAVGVGCKQWHCLCIFCARWWCKDRGRFPGDKAAAATAAALCWATVRVDETSNEHRTLTAEQLNRWHRSTDANRGRCSSNRRQNVLHIVTLSWKINSYNNYSITTEGVIITVIFFPEIKRTTIRHDFARQETSIRGSNVITRACSYAWLTG